MIGSMFGKYGSYCCKTLWTRDMEKRDDYIVVKKLEEKLFTEFCELLKYYGTDIMKDVG